MNKKLLILSISIILLIFIVFIIFKISNKRNQKIDLNEEAKNIVDISQSDEIIEDEVTDECLDEWEEYNKMIREKIEEASNNLTEDDTNYIIKDILGYIEVYYVDENNIEYLYKKTTIPTAYLSQEDVQSLKNGIKVVGSEALNKILEDFE